MDWVSLEAGVALGALLLLALLMILAVRRSRLVDRMNVRLRGPMVPESVLDAVRGAEVRWYQGLPTWRRLVKDAQDSVGVLAPHLVYRLNSSIGPYRIKARTVRGLIGYALEHDYLRIDAVQDPRLDKLLPYFSLQPVLNDWQAALLLQSLKDEHPALAGRSWDEIASDPEAVAKLYSGYMGAGGDWAGWLADDAPGPVARQRLGLGAP